MKNVVAPYSFSNPGTIDTELVRSSRHIDLPRRAREFVYTFVAGSIREACRVSTTRIPRTLDKVLALLEDKQELIFSELYAKSDQVKVETQNSLAHQLYRLFARLCSVGEPSVLMIGGDLHQLVVNANSIAQMILKGDGSDVLEMAGYNMDLALGRVSESKLEVRKI
jgi:hypothetical protein